MLRPLLLAVNQWRAHDRVALGDLVAALGERSFGWALLVFAIVNLMPLPLGSTLVTGIPLILLTAQMAMRLPKVWLPRVIAARSVSRTRLRRATLSLRPVVRPVERVLRPRLLWVFAPKWERMMGVILLGVSVALFIPLPLSGWFPAIALVVTSIGLIEQDGLVTLAGLIGGLFTIALCAGVGISIVLGANLLI